MKSGWEEGPQLMSPWYYLVLPTWNLYAVMSIYIIMSLYNGSNLTLWKLTRFESGQLSRKWKPILSFQDIQATCLLIENDDDWDDCFRQNG